MKQSLVIHCPPMPVKNTSWWGNPFADRMTDNLLCTTETKDINGNVVSLQVVFPPCRVRRVTDQGIITAVKKQYNLTDVDIRALWMVDPVVAISPDGADTFVRISFGAEPCYRRPDGIMVVLPVDSYDGIIRLKDGRQGLAASTLPDTFGRPAGLFGLWQYVVDAVDMPGEVTW
jgi:hypothetical protein